jgi:hypothetical protein
MKLVKTALKFDKSGTAPFTIETSPEHIKLHTVCLLIGKRGSGKTFMASHLLKWLEYDMLILVSPTFESNQAQLKGLPISSVMDPDDPLVVQTINDIVNAERDDLLKYREQKKMLEDLKQLYGAKSFHLNEDYHLFKEFVDIRGNWVEPTHKWKGRKPRIAIFLDDTQSTKIFRNNQFLNLVTRSRHLGQFKGDAPSIGVSLFISAQNYTATGGGLPKVVRGNATHMCLWRTKNTKELDMIASEFGGEVSEDHFKKVYNYVMDFDPNDKFVSLFIDLHKKDTHPSMFRRNYTEFVVDT